MTDNLTPAAPARFYGFARTRTFPEYVATLNPLGADTASSDAAIVDIPAEGEVQAQQSEPSNEPEASQEVGGSASNSIVLASKDADDIGPNNADSTAPAAIEVAVPRAKSKRRKKSHPKKKKKSSPPSKRLSRLELHQAHCRICGDKLQEDVDQAFLNWECVNEIALEYGLDRSAVYRHAHATGLFPKRDRNIRRALGHIIHKAGSIAVTADSVVRAVKILTHLNAHGEWVNPPTQVVFSTAPQRADRVRGSQPRPGTAPSTAELSATPSHLIKELKP